MFKIFQLWDNIWSWGAKDSSFSSWMSCTIFCFFMFYFAILWSVLISKFIVFFSKFGVRCGFSQVDCIRFWFEKNPLKFQGLNLCLNSKWKFVFTSWKPSLICLYWVYLGGGLGNKSWAFSWSCFFLNPFYIIYIFFL